MDNEIVAASTVISWRFVCLSSGNGVFLKKKPQKTVAVGASMYQSVAEGHCSNKSLCGFFGCTLGFMAVINTYNWLVTLPIVNLSAESVNGKTF